jgi:hypothetical protein
MFITTSSHVIFTNICYGSTWQKWFKLYNVDDQLPNDEHKSSSPSQCHYKFHLLSNVLLYLFIQYDLFVFPHFVIKLLVQLEKSTHEIHKMCVNSHNHASS